MIDWCEIIGKRRSISMTHLADRLSAIQPSLLRIAPFALYIAFMVFDEVLRFLSSHGYVNIPADAYLYLYPVKAMSVGVLLIVLRKSYPEIHWADLKRPAATLAGTVVGIVVFLLWINMTWPWAVFGQLYGYDPTSESDIFARSILMVSRIIGASVVVPVMEEIFWRSWLMRYVISPDFRSVEIGRFTISSFLIGTVMFGFEHNLWIAGLMAGCFYNILLYRTKSLAQCILAHAITNLLLGLYVLHTGKWYFW